MRHSISRCVGLAFVAGSLLTVVLTGCGGSTPQTSAPQGDSVKDPPRKSSEEAADGSGKGMAAIDQAVVDDKIDPQTEEAVTVFLVPPGSAVAEYKGATDKAELVSTLQKASSGCCPGGSCGPGGCK